MISGCSTESPSVAQQMKQLVCMALLTDMVSLETRDGSEVVVIKGVVK